MGGALDAVLAQDSVDEQEAIGTHSMYSEPASSAYPAVKTPGSSPRTEGGLRIAQEQDSAFPGTERPAGQEAGTFCAPAAGIGPQIA